LDAPTPNRSIDRSGRGAEGRDELLTIDVLSADGTALLRLHGDLDLANAGALVQAGQALVADGSAHIVLDCGHLRFCDSGGLNAFLAIRQTPGVESVTVVRSSATLRRLLRVTALDMLFEPAPTAPTPALSRLAHDAARAVSA